MDLKCPCLVFMTNGELRRLAVLVPLEEIKWLNIQMLPFLSRAANKEVAVNTIGRWSGGEVAGRGALNNGARQGIAAATSLSNCSLPQAGPFHRSFLGCDVPVGSFVSSCVC